MSEIIYKDLSYQVQGAFFEISKKLKNCFKEKVYHRALIKELSSRSLSVSSEHQVPIYYKSSRVGTYVPDLIVEDRLLIEIKCKPALIREDVRQFWQYLKGSNYKVGYLVNFGKPGKVEYLRRVYDTARREGR